MKRCEYCGTEYPDDTTVCTIDRQPLAGDGAAVTMAQAEKGVITAPLTARKKSNTYVPYPEYRWSARDAWKYLGMGVVFHTTWYFAAGALGYISPDFHHWYRSPVGHAATTVIYAGLWVLTAAYFARTETIAWFCRATGLNRKPTGYVWFGIVAALTIRLVGHFVFVFHLARGYSNYDLHAFETTYGPGRYLFLFPLLLAAFWEEPVNRGFLYKAFRGSHSVPVATVLIVAWTAYTHWDQYRHFGWAVISLSALTVVQCYLREKSDSLWDCIFCHLAFNASSLFIFGVLG